MTPFTTFTPIIGDSLWTVIRVSAQDLWIIVSWPDGSWDLIRRTVKEFKSMIEKNRKRRKEAV